MGTFEYTHFGVGDGLRRWNTWDCDQFGVLIREWCWSTSFSSNQLAYLILTFATVSWILYWHHRPDTTLMFCIRKVRR